MTLQQQLDAARVTFFAQRLRLLEQALLVEDHLRQIVRNMGAPIQVRRKLLGLDDRTEKTSVACCADDETTFAVYWQ